MELTCQASGPGLSEPLRKTIKLIVTKTPTKIPKLTTTDLITSSSTTTTYEYDDEEEDDQLDYYADYNNTDNVANVQGIMVLQNIPNETKQNENELVENMDISEEINDLNAVDAFKDKGKLIADKQNMSNLI